MSVILTGCGASESNIFEQAASEYGLQQPVTEKTSAEPVYLELHYGDGTVLCKEIYFISTPYERTSSQGTLVFHHYWSENFEKIDGMLDTKQNLSYQSTVTFHDGRVLSFTDAYSLEMDMEGRTIIANLWRDTPYETEKEYFETVGK